MGWHPDPKDRAAWSAAGGVVMAVAASGAIAWLLAVEPSSSNEPTWPVYGFAAVAVIGLYGMLAPLLRWWPWRNRSANAKMNHLIRREWRGIRRRRWIQRFLRRSAPSNMSKETELMLTTEPPPLAEGESPLRQVEKADLTQEASARAVDGVSDSILRRGAGVAPHPHDAESIDAMQGKVAQQEAELASTWTPPPLPPPAPGDALLRAQGQHPEQREQRNRTNDLGKTLVSEITKAQHAGLSTPKPFAEMKAAELTASVETWATVFGGYVVPEPARDNWQLTLARLKNYVERELAAQRAKQEQP
jgi:hypothetical protein